MLAPCVSARTQSASTRNAFRSDGHIDPCPTSFAAPSNRADRKLLVGVDRLDYTKGIDRRLAAFERLLDQHPDLHGTVEMFQLAVPSRDVVPSVRRLSAGGAGMCRTHQPAIRDAGLDTGALRARLAGAGAAA